MASQTKKTPTPAAEKLAAGLCRVANTDNLSYQFILNGKRYRGTTHTADPLKAAAVLAKVRANLGVMVTQPTPVQKQMLTSLKKELYTYQVPLADMWQEFMKNDTLTTFRKAQQKWVADFVAYMASTYPQITVMNDVTADHANTWLSVLVSSGPFLKSVDYTRNGKTLNYEMGYTELSPETIKKYIGVCKLVFDRLATKSGLDSNPFAKLKTPKISKSSEREIYTDDEITLMLQKATPETKPLVEMGLCTGLREGDICLLKCSAVNLETKTISHHTNKTGKLVQIPIVNGLFDYLSSLPHDTDFVFPVLADMYQKNRSGVSYRFNHWLTDIGIKPKSDNKTAKRQASKKDVHSLRHTFVYLALTRYQLPLPIVMDIVGHVTEAMTRRYSDHATMADKRRYMGAMDSQPKTKTHNPKQTIQRIFESGRSLDAMRKRIAVVLRYL
jgi:integrase